MNQKTRILGIDPGTSLIGYGVVDILGNTHKAITFGALRTKSNIDNKDRVKEVYLFFQKLIKKYSPDVMAIETLFFFKNAKTVLKVSEIRGVFLLLASMNNLHVKEFTPLQVKQAVSTYGRADKDQIQRMVTLILELPEPPKPDDVADALALAICCGNTTLY